MYNCEGEKSYIYHNNKVERHFEGDAAHIHAFIA